MKKLLTLIAAILISIQLFAQAPQKMSYQAVIRNASNALVTNAPVKMKISILQGSATGSAVYSELHSATTNANGLASIEIGGGTSQQGTFSNINWGNGTYFLKTETDPAGGDNYSITGTSQLLSVPYALYAGNVVNNGGKPIIYLTGNISNSQAQAQIAAEFGPNTVEVRVESCLNITSLDLSVFTKLVVVKIKDNPQLQSINFSNLKFCSDLNIFACPSLNSIDLSSLINLTGSDPTIADTKLTTLNLNSLSYANQFSLIRNNLLINVSLPSLNRADYIRLSENSQLSSVSIPALNSVQSIFINNNSNLSSIDISNLQNLGFIANFISNKLSSTQINSLINKFVNISPALTGKTFAFQGQNPPAPPTGQGLTDKATLISKGNSVTTD